MIQEVYKPSHLFWSKLISVIIKPFILFIDWFKNTPAPPFNVKKSQTILITEYHRIGDVVMLIPALDMIKKAIPLSRIILITNSDTVQLAEKLRLADTIIGFSSPWTNWEWSLSRWKDTVAFGIGLRKLKVDLAIDFKGDIRNNWFLWLTGSKKRVGYDATGGSYFLTSSFEFPFSLHQSERSLQLLSLIKIPELNRKRNKSSNNVLQRGKIVLHPGASDTNRCWPIERWVELIKQLYGKYSLAIVKIPGLENTCDEIIQQTPDIEVFKGSLIGFYNWLKYQRMLIGIDSMAGHLAAYIGLPTVTIFGSQNPDLTKPTGEISQVVHPVAPCNHVKNHWRLCAQCMKSVTALMVYKSIIYIENSN